METDSLIVHIKTGDIYGNIVEDFETRFHTSNLKDHYINEKTKKVIGLMKNELHEKIMTDFTILRQKEMQLLGK